LTPRQSEILVAFQRNRSLKATARELEIEPKTVRTALDAIGWDTERRAEYVRDPAIAEAMAAVGTKLQPALAWAKTAKGEDGTSYSVLLKPAPEERESFLDEMRSIIASLDDKPRKLPPAFDEGDGHLLVLDPSDVHIGKLSVEAETGYHYDCDVAEHRLVEGCRLLMERGKRNGVTHVLLVIGNDIAHIDTPRRTTTSGTPQDTHGSIFSIYRAAKRGYVRVVDTGLKMGLSVQVVFNPSNHDWVLGYSIAETVAAWFRGHPNVIASDYGISERHRKYVRFGRNLIGLSHGDGAKEADLPQIMLQEARGHIADCPHRYFYLHHFHHKISKHIGVRPMAREKDHIAMTVMRSGAGAMEGDNLAVEYVRSPSPPDSWHDRNGYLNRQAVEAFIHDAQDGQIMRLTGWF